MQTTTEEKVKLPTITDDELKMMWRDNPFAAFENIPITESRMRCLDQIAGNGEYLSRLLEWAPEWLEFLMRTHSRMADTQMITKLLNVWVFHFAHSKISLAKTVNAALALAMDDRFAGGTSTLEIFSKEVCSCLLKANDYLYWEIPSLHPFLDKCLGRLTTAEFQEKDWNVVRRALQIICEAGDTSVIPRLTQLRGTYQEFNEVPLIRPLKHPRLLWKKLDVVQHDAFLEQCIEFLMGRRKEEIDQHDIFRVLIGSAAYKLGFQEIPPPEPYHHAYERLTIPSSVVVGVRMKNIQEPRNDQRAQDLVKGLEVTFLGDGIENVQVMALTPVPTEPTHDKVGKFNPDLECLFRLSEGMKGKKRFCLKVHATEPIRELRPTLLCTLTGYLRFE